MAGVRSLWEIGADLRCDLLLRRKGQRVQPVNQHRRGAEVLQGRARFRGELAQRVKGRCRLTVKSCQQQVCEAALAGHSHAAQLFVLQGERIAGKTGGIGALETWIAEGNRRSGRQKAENSVEHSVGGGGKSYFHRTPLVSFHS